MKKTKFHRLLAFVLAFTFIMGGAFSVSAATADEGSTTDKTLAEIKEELNAISYDAYCQKYGAFDRATEEIVIPGKDYDKDLTNADVRVTTTTGGTEEALHTPASGTVSWKVNIPATAKYSIVIEYWPDEGKVASIERILKINNAIPFAEARYITLPKVWQNQYTQALVRDEHGKISLETLSAEALAAGFTSADIVEVEVTEKGKTFKESFVQLEIPKVWTQALADYVNTYTVRFLTKDIDRNELRPTMAQCPEWCAYELRDADGFYAETFEFLFEAGEQVISLEAMNEPMTIKSITLVPHKDMESYESYLSRFPGAVSGSDWVSIQAEYVGATSSQTIYPVEDRSDANNMPTDTSRTLLNTIGGEKWQTAGQWVRYSFKVSSSGLYNIAARYRQNMLDGMFVCRSLYIVSKGAEVGSAGYYGGKIPFAEASELRFNYGTDWQSTLLNNGKDPFKFYFEAGVEYTVMMQVTLGSMGDIVRRVDEALTAVNDDYLSIIKLTGATPDEYRDYGFSRAMPDTLIDMAIQARELYNIAAELAAASGGKSSNIATLERIAWLLERMSSDEREIAKYLDQLKSYIGSLGTWLGDVKTQPLQLDYIVIQPLDQEAPVGKAGFFKALWHEITSFIQSFFRNYNRMGATAEDAEGEHTIDVWLATGRDQAQVLRNLINNDFPNYTEEGTLVNLKLVAGGTLLPSVLAGMGPDVYIGIGQGDVINYAIRGALLPIEKMSGFKDFALYYEVDEHFNTIYDENGKPVVNLDANGEPEAQFNEAAMLVLGIADANGDFHYYGLPETQSFNMMFVRKDILADLNIEIPKTWDDILEAVTVLQANNMQIGMHTDYKIFLYQMGGELFADDGMRINLDSNTGLEAFETMCNFFTMYSFPYSYNFANRFRTGEMPIGFAAYNGTYNHLTVFATEIKGLWEFYPMPGIEYINEDGSSYINNVAVSGVSAICMMNGCDNETGAWEFMKWHSGVSFQVQYSNEMVAIIGPSAKHATANIKALREMPWTTAEYRQLSYQFNNLASIPNYPGSYIIDRYTNFAFLAAYEDNADPITELQSYITTINKEITRKRQEFHLETLELGETLAQKRMRQVEEAFEEETRRMDEATLASAQYAITLMEEGLDSEDAVTLQKAAEEFGRVNATAFKETIKALGNAAVVLSR